MNTQTGVGPLVTAPPHVPEHAPRPGAGAPAPGVSFFRAVQARGTLIFRAVQARPGRWLATTLGFVLLYHVLLLVAVVVSFGKLPNYAELYDWPGNVAGIFRATPSLSDALSIAADEWLLEVGHMNYDYGHGISEWSLNVLPTKLALVALLGAALATLAAVLRAPGAACTLTRGRRGTALAGAGLGATLAGAASATLFWVVCCASPSWVVGLAMLGLVSVPVAFMIEPLENWLILGGFALLAASVWSLAGQGRAGPVAGREAGP